MERLTRIRLSCGLHLLLVSLSDTDHGITKFQLSLQPSFQEAQSWLNWARHLNAILPSLQDGDTLTAEMGLLRSRGNWSWNPSICRVWFRFSTQQQFRTELHSSVCNYLVAGKLISLHINCIFLQIYLYLCILTAVLWICQNTVEIFGLFMVTKEIYSNEKPPRNWTSTVPVAVFLLWTQVKGTLKPPQHPLEWSTGCFGIQ